MVQALAGLTRAGEEDQSFEQALRTFRERPEQLDFGWLWWGWDEITLLELGRAARALGKFDQAATFIGRACKRGSVEAHAEHLP